MKENVLVTGYGGFLGKEVCRQLLERGFRVTGLARRTYPEMGRLGVRTIQGDATDIKTCELACQGMDAIVHTAAVAGVWGPKDVFESINVTATRNLLDASARRNLRAFVYCSSPSVTFNGLPQSGIDESVPYPTSWLCDYPRTKAIAEQMVIAANRPVDENAFFTCSLRPHLIWGEGDPHLIPRLIQRCQSKKLRRVGDGKNLIDTVHVRSAALAHCLALEQMLGGNVHASGRSYFITDGDPIGCWEWISMILSEAGLVPPSRSISQSMAFRIGAALEWVYRTFRIASEPPMTRFVALQLGVDHYFSIAAAKEHLGYTPSINRQAELAKMEGWLKSLIK